MFVWLKEMGPFLEVNMSKMMQEYHIDHTSQISYYHPAAQKMRNNLQQLENALSAQDGRQGSVMRLSTPNTTALWNNPDSQERHVFYNFDTDEYHLAWYPNKCALGYILKLIHEHTHANQNLNCTVTSDEFKLTATERACLAHTEDECYWSQYTEMTARIAEAEAWQQLVTTYKDKFTLSELEQLERYGRNLVDRLTFNVSPENIQLLKTIQHECFKTQSVNRQALKKAFPHILTHSSTSDASRFLKSDAANNLHKQAFDKIFDMQKQIKETLDALQKQIEDTHNTIAADAMHQKECEIRSFAAQYHIDILPDVPFPVPPLCIHIDSKTNIEQLIDKYSPTHNVNFGQIMLGGTPQWYLLGESKTVDVREDFIDDERDGLDDFSL